TSFQIQYDWSDFRGDPDEMLEKYFDVFAYVASGGCRRLMFRFPKKLLDVKALKSYSAGNCVEVRATRKYDLVGFRRDFDGEEDEEGEGWLDSMEELRADLLAGDVRALYLGWLMSVERDQTPPESEEPPVPASLDELKPALSSFVGFFKLDTDLIGAAGSRSGARETPAPSSRELAAFVKAIPLGEKDSLLLRAIKGDVPHLRAELLRAFDETRPPEPKSAKKKPEPRTAAQLLAASERRAAGRAARS
ncbi:MAG: hypothetical protein HY303_09905, partial [Candidatus Wallbacteria bacterium]|nr:hypothetical protein [Candidatus Wallbacteria bacterium]